jgi:Flp pilus assembly protein TadD
MNPKIALSSALFLMASLGSPPAIAEPSAAMPVQIAPLQIAQAENELDFWNAIKDSKQAEDYQAYLDKYPNGNFADLAKLRLKKYAPAAPAAAAAEDSQQQDIAYWNAIKSSKNADDYKTYLDKYPNGEFVDLAKLRIEQYGAPAAQPAEPAPTAAPVEQPAQPASAEPASVEPPASPASAPVLTFEAKNATVYAKSGGQVRAEPDAKAALVTKLKTNTEVHAIGLSSDGKWWRVEVAGQSGYMHRTVVSEKPVAAAPSNKKKSTEEAAVTGPDEEICKPASPAAPNARVSACERLVAKAGDDTAKIAALGDLAAALNQAKRRDEAIRKYEQAAVLAPRDATIYYRIGLVRLDQRRFPEARAAFQKAAQLDPKNSDIVFQRGISYIGVGDFEKAKLEVERALLIPNDAAAYYEKLGEINIARGDLASAKVALERGGKADASRRSLILAAVSYFVGAEDAAASQAAVSLGDPTAALWSAVVKKAKGDAAGAAEALETGQADAGDAWPGPIFAVLSGDTSLAKARAAAKNRDDNTRFQQLCALNFFAGEWAYLAGDKDAARAALQAAVDTRAYWTLEYAAAKARLANMGG